ncbi:MAG: lysozyme inhibitor LprI family protein [Janthinobacterium lividum]
MRHKCSSSLLVLASLSTPVLVAAQAPAITHGAAANREYAVVFSRSDKPCSADYATVPYLDCMSKELALIETHLDIFVEDLRGLTGSPEELAAFNANDAAWRTYRETATLLPLNRYGSGTIKPVFAAEARWHLDREYMVELSDFYIRSQFPDRSPSR